MFISMALLLMASGANAQMPVPSEAEGMGGNLASDDHTAREEAEGRAIWEKLQAKQAACADLSDDDFEALGEYFMGQMMGDSHEAMNEIMTQMHGEEGEKQIHIIIGKRLSDCDASVALPMVSGGWMPMMQMMMGGWSSPFGFNSTNDMMNFSFGPFGGFGWIFMVFWWGLIIVAVVALIKWLANQFKSGTSGKTALDILKERYAKGEIDKKEFEDKKRELTS